MPAPRRIAVLAAIASMATLGFSASTHAGVPLPQYATLTIARGGEHVMPMNIAVRPGVPVVLNINNYSREYHTFTIRALGVSFLVLPAKGAWARVTTVRFTPPAVGGSLAWRCAICPSGSHRARHVMGGTIDVTA